MKNEYPWICVLFLVTNCMLRLQPTNVILQKPLKCHFANYFKQQLATSIHEQVENKDFDIRLEHQINILCEKLCS
jgi:hypothetical protein